MKVQFAKAFASAGGVGYIPLASGTWGSLVGVGLVLAIKAAQLSWIAEGALFIVGCSLSVLAIWVCERNGWEHDDSRIVIDEVFGQWVTLWLFGDSPLELVAGFLLFRLFDIWKPWPIYLIDRRMTDPFSTFFDDILAGIYAGIVLYGIMKVI